ncbi:MAG: undecaprenyl-diphosphate phosphatase [Oscillospiraceae bacterium]|nr:undecaprenyl-diphosphate phosphatase [Oscillospiraceae bacterium]
MTAWQAIVLGFIQGLTEFLPVSSSGHLSIFQNLFGMGKEGTDNVFFDVLLHLATLVSVCVAYRADIQGIIGDLRDFIHNTRHPSPGVERRRYKGVRLLFMVVIGTLPLVLILPIHKQIERLYDSTLFIGIALILTGAMLWVSDRMPQGRKKAGNMAVWDAVLVGVSQAIATVPGLSRSGTTIAAGITAGLSRQFAVKFSFLLSIPAVLGANLLSLMDAFSEGIDWSTVPACLLGMLVAGVVGYCAIILLRWIVHRGKFGYFAYYCAFAGVLTLILTAVLR